MVCAWPEPPSAMAAEPSAGVRDGMEAFAFGTTETPGKVESDVQTALNLPGSPENQETSEPGNRNKGRHEHRRAVQISPNEDEGPYFTTAMIGP